MIIIPDAYASIDHSHWEAVGVVELRVRGDRLTAAFQTLPNPFDPGFPWLYLYGVLLGKRKNEEIYIQIQVSAASKNAAAGEATIYLPENLDESEQKAIIKAARLKSRPTNKQTMTHNKEDDRMPCMDCGGDNEPLPRKATKDTKEPNDSKDQDTNLWPSHLG